MKCEELRTQLGGSAIRYDKDRVMTSPEDTFSQIMAQIIEIEDKIARIEVFVMDHQGYAEKVINHMANDIQRDALRLYYLSTTRSGKPLGWKEVARQMGRGEKYLISRVHPSALREFERSRNYV